MQTPLQVALDIQRVIARARAEKAAINVSNCAAEMYLRFVGSGCTRRDIAEVLEREAEAAGVTLH